MNKLDEESKAHVKNVISTGRHAAHLMCNPEQVRPLDDNELDAEWKRVEAGGPAPSGPVKPLEGYAAQRLQGIEPWRRVDATDAAREAIAQNAEVAPDLGISDILKGRPSGDGPPALSTASATYQDVTREALQGHKTVAAEAGAPAFLRKAFSLCERDDAAVDLHHLNTLQKVSTAFTSSQSLASAIRRPSAMWYAPACLPMGTCLHPGLALRLHVLLDAANFPVQDLSRITCALSHLWWT